jgi:hypothetical protein
MLPKSAVSKSTLPKSAALICATVAAPLLFVGAIAAAAAQSDSLPTYGAGTEARQQTPAASLPTYCDPAQGAACGAQATAGTPPSRPITLPPANAAKPAAYGPPDR